MTTPVQQRNAARVDRMTHALKAAMATDPDSKVIIAAFVTVLEQHPELGAMFEDLCSNVLVKTTMHEHQRWLADARRTEKDLR